MLFRSKINPGSLLKLFLATLVINTYPVSSITLILLYLPSFLEKEKKKRDDLLTFPEKKKDELIFNKSTWRRVNFFFFIDYENR